MKQKKVNKQEFIERIAENAKISKTDASLVLNSITNVIEEAMLNDEDIVIPGFGAFKVQHVKSKMGRNIHTGESVVIPEKKKIKFTAGKALQEKMNM